MQLLIGETQGGPARRVVQGGNAPHPRELVRIPPGLGLEQRTVRDEGRGPEGGYTAGKKGDQEGEGGTMYLRSGS